MIDLINVCKKYTSKSGEKTTALNNVTIKLNHKGMTFITGKSGSGKTTLLNIIGGLDKPDTGEIIIDNKNINNFKNIDYDYYRNNYVGFIFQEFNIIEDYTVYENIVLSIKMQNNEIDENEIDKLLIKLGIIEIKNRKINETSGGQKQRVAIARAIAKKSKFILADEPTGNLDSVTGDAIMQLLKEISKDILVIVVSHDQNNVDKYSDHVINIQDGIATEKISNLEKVNDRKYYFKKTKLPFVDAFRFGLLFLKNKKIRTIVTSFLISFTVVFVVISYTLGNYKIDQKHLEILKKENVETLEIKKYIYKDKNSFKLTDGYPYGFKGAFAEPLVDEDIEYISKNIKSENSIVYTFNNTYNFIDLFDLNIYVPNDPYEYVQYDIYTNYLNNIRIIDDVSWIEEDILGSYPINDDEILISNYIADLMIKYGIMIDDTAYYPKTYQDILDMEKKVIFNTGKIVGIINYDLKEFQVLNNIYSREINDEYMISKSFIFSDKVTTIYNIIYTNKDYLNKLATSNEVYKTSIIIREKNFNEIKSIINKFSYDNKYSAYTPHLNNVEAFYNHINTFKPIINIMTIIFLVFSFSLTYNLMMINLIKKKKEIGILRSMGARKSDIINIFIIEALVLTFFVTIISLPMIIVSFDLLNETLFTFSVTTSVLIFNLNIDTIILMITFTIVTISLSMLNPLMKASKMKPIDAMLNK